MATGMKAKHQNNKSFEISNNAWRREPKKKNQITCIYSAEKITDFLYFSPRFNPIFTGLILECA